MTDRELFDGLRGGGSSIPRDVAETFFIAIKQASMPPTYEERRRDYDRLKQAALKYAKDSLLSPMSDGVPSGDDPLSDVIGTGEDGEAYAHNTSKDPNRNIAPPQEVANSQAPMFTPEEMDQARRAEQLYQEALLEAMGKEEEANHYRAALEDVQGEKELLEQQMQQYAQQAQQAGMAAQQMQQQIGAINQQLAAKDQELMGKDQQYSQLLTSIRNYQAQVQSAVTQAPLPGPEMAVPGAMPGDPGAEQVPQGAEMPQEGQAPQAAPQAPVPPAVQPPQIPGQPQAPVKTAAFSDGARELMSLAIAKAKDPAFAVPTGAAVLGAGMQYFSDRRKDKETGLPRKVVAMDNKIKLMEKIQDPTTKQKYQLALARASKALAEHNAENPRHSMLVGATIGGFVGKEMLPIVRRGINVIGPVIKGNY